MTTSEDFKSQGNQAFSAGDFSSAIDYFTKAINLDAKNHVLYSNRSAAYASLKQYKEAVQDAETTVSLKSDWPKGYGRKGAALYGLGDLEGAAKAYEEGLKIEPTNSLLKKGLEDVERAMNDSPLSSIANMFGPDMWAKLAANPKLSPYLAQPDVVSMLQECQKDPKNMSNFMKDQRMMQIMLGLMGLDGAMATNPEEMEKAKAEAEENIEARNREEEAKNAAAAKPEPVPEPEISSEEQEKKRKREVSDAHKAKGNDLYKKRKFEEALVCYDEAWNADNTNVAVLTNKAAVLFEMEKYEETIKVCEIAVETGREAFADFKLIGRALGRIGNAYSKLNDLENAVKYYKKALTEHRTADILSKLRDAEIALEEKAVQAYINPEISVAEREKGNEFFKTHEYPLAVKCYTEAIKRNPKDAKNYSNRAAAYAKLIALPEAERDCDEAIKIDPSFVKVYIRKAGVQFSKREYSKCIETCNLALEKDVEKKHIGEINDQMRKAQYALYGAGQTEEGRQEALKNPEVQKILGDPVMQTILRQMQEDPAAIRDHMKNPDFAKKMQVLMDAGVVQMR